MLSSNKLTYIIIKFVFNVAPRSGTAVRNNNKFSLFLFAIIYSEPAPPMLH